eukprot:CAMPEP_0184865280 /NCGR_PEP_ID=MMETSP0580-20130426/17515_1 /TAXON_ID=1118495 /ORGANISM="Dactyliosolen fragilissimus" /LENGTH=965 /DNA_ID=CAMNT_0027364403 /DNA_START=20 /DNA_END=2917 /DNA_ORIENTATION=-
MSLKLRDLIRQVRACKTASEERAVIAKESAMIRTAIREEQVHYRHRNVAKLLFMHMLGYPTHFGQLECMKLIASPHFPEKRIGYLGMMLLLSEEADVLMLSTNALKNDLNNDNKFVSGLALCAIGNLATSDMSRDLAPEVDKHLKSSQPYLRKKACLAMARCLSKCPDMVEDFVDRVVTLLKDRSHGVLITVVQLMIQVLVLDEKYRHEADSDDEEESPCKAAFVRLVPSLVKLLRNLSSPGHSDLDGGSSDTFLQVQILNLLRLLGTGNEKVSEEMSDVLAQVITNTETSKNSGNAILYECVQTVMAIESEDSLKVLAVNILGRFLLNRDNNIRYVALNTLSKCIVEQKERDDHDFLESSQNANSAASALQRHRTLVVDCLKDPDISIRQRALELIYHLVNNDNVESLTAELLNYLVLCPREHRTDICGRILRVVEKFSPDDRWRVDTLITMLTIAGRECARDVQSSAIIYISRSSEDLHAYAAHKLLKAIRDDDGSQHGLLVVGIWCVGEYGDLLLDSYSYTPSAISDIADLTSAQSENGPVNISFMGLDPMDIITTIEGVINKHTCPEYVKHHALTCFVKLSNRFETVADPATSQKLHKLVKANNESHLLELQLRSCEYDALINAMKGLAPNSGSSSNNDIFAEVSSGKVSDDVSKAAKEALARMPVVDLSIIQRKRESNVVDRADDVVQNDKSNSVTNVASSNGGSLLDLTDIFGPTEPAESQEGKTVIDKKKGSDVVQSDTTKSDVDLLSDIFSAPPINSSQSELPSTGSNIDPFSSIDSGEPKTLPPVDLFSPTSLTPSSTPSISSNALPNDIFGVTSKQSSLTIESAPNEPSNDSVTVPGFSHQGLVVEFECSKTDIWNKQKSTLTLKFKNVTDAPFYGFSLQCAVPKFVTIEMNPPSSTTIPVSGSHTANQVTQIINVTNSMLGTKNLMVKVKVAFTSKGNKVEHMATCAEFPAGNY